MDLKRDLRKGAALLAGITVLLCSAGTAFAEDGTTAPTTEAETTAASEATTTTEPTTAPADPEKEKEEEPEWFKAELTQYDDSLSLISYATPPEDEGKPKTEKKKKSEEDVEPTPVENIATGGFVGEIPGVQGEPYIDAQPGQFAIVTYGWGHGVGMSQNGANFYAEYSGWNYQDILFHYYPETYLMNTGLAEEEELVINGVSGDVLTMLSQVVFNEVGSSMNYEAMKAQAVAAYTYCKYHGNNGSDLRCKPNPPQIVVDAVSEVLGEALYYDGDYALTMFSASSGGITANCYEVFWADIPYLRSVSSDYDAALDPHYGTVTYFSDDQIRSMIEKNYGIKLGDDPGKWIQPNYSDETGYVTLVNIDDQKIVRGYEFKMAMGLKSSKFNVYYTYRPAPAVSEPEETPAADAGTAPQNDTQPASAPAEEAPTQPAEEKPADTEENTAGAQ